MRPRNQRRSQLLQGVMRAGTTEHAIIIRNVSTRGIGARVIGTPPMVGQEVHVRFGERERVGRIRWVRGSLVGVHLRDSLEDITPNFATQARALDNSPVPGFTVLERFRPETKAWRPGVRSIRVRKRLSV